MPGLFEVRIGNDILYTDAEGNYLIQGTLIDTRSRKNLTEERIDKLTAINFKDLQLKDAFTIVRGNGKRKLAVFEDPNCGYCKRFEADLQKIDNVTVYTFLIPILGADSAEKSKQIWCSADKAKTWDDWMLRHVAPKGTSKCDTAALDANVALRASTTSPARPPWCSSTATACPAPSTRSRSSNCSPADLRPCRPPSTTASKRPT
jgi:thiol:disulfide interchange protein DsbC